MNASSILGPRKDVAEILRRLGVSKDDYKEEYSKTMLQQPFVKVPGVGEVLRSRLQLDDVVTKAYQEVTELIHPEGETEKPDKIQDWYHSMLLAKALNLELLSNKEYWQCLKWASSNDPEFAKTLKEFNWTRTLIIWDDRTEQAKRLLRSHNYQGQFPAVIEGPEVIPDATFGRIHNHYVLEGGKLITPSKQIIRPEESNLAEEWYFNWEDMEELTAIPTIKRNKGKFVSRYIEVEITPILCCWPKGFKKYGFFANTHADHWLEIVETPMINCMLMKKLS